MSDHRFHLKINRMGLIGILVFSGLLAVWLYLTPQGLLGKADAIGYAVCHRISERTFHLGERQLPLCARCSGMYTGAFIGFLFQALKGRKGGFPKKRFLAAFAVLLAMFGVDGVNSYLHLFPNFPSLYEPNNVFRLLTGTGVGVGMAVVLMPIIHQSLWADWNTEPAIRGWRDMAILLVSAWAVSALMLTENPLFLYPLALISAATVAFILGLIYTIIWIMLFKKENAFSRWIDVTGYLGLGFGLAIFQILAIDLARLIFTGTWNGFNF
jgi:uncharacterized membrane protein